MDICMMSRSRRCRDTPNASATSSSRVAATCTRNARVRSARACGSAPAQPACKPHIVMEGFAPCGGLYPISLFGLPRAPLSPQFACTYSDVEPSGHVVPTFAIADGTGTMSDETIVARDSLQSANAANVRTPPFRALDPELPSLAARAAFQLDNLRLEAQGKIHEESRQDAIAKFASRLQGALQLPPGADKKSLLDPLTTSILHGAVLQATSDKPNSLDEVLAQIGRLTEQLLQIDGFKAKTDMIVALRDFCLAISDLASSKQRLVRSPRPQSPKSSRL